ncbi:RNA polymerase sigma factor [Novosphingobium sp. 2580]|uniref:RNA polymerase sigma factor n=1 Tax=Novosphingobium album (ex Hu et al. 2023) TaxID=2930093 RepID=A0ABT0B7D5_9SPHN|nr:RNA polymerase sigma factor [Novosphingobium album (ex Hu et al. 2023)]MCJ2180928.1 RNA polymerase sigma factor [Novosphingobium album (ex Hu et al. 2023)]
MVSTPEPDGGLADDAAAVRSALSGGQDGFRVLMQRHREAIFRFVRGYVGEDSEAMDLTQDCFVAAFAALHRYDLQRSFRSWLLRIAVNKCHDWNRRRTVRRFFTFALPEEEAFRVPDTAPGPEENLASAMEVARINAAIAELPANLKEPLLLCAIEGFSQDETARVLGVSRKAVETRIYRARQKLSQVLQG